MCCLIWSRCVRQCRRSRPSTILLVLMWLCCFARLTCSLWFSFPTADQSCHAGAGWQGSDQRARGRWCQCFCRRFAEGEGGRQAACHDQTAARVHTTHTTPLWPWQTLQSHPSTMLLCERVHLRADLDALPFVLATSEVSRYRVGELRALSLLCGFLQHPVQWASCHVQGCGFVLGSRLWWGCRPRPQ